MKGEAFCFRGTREKNCQTGMHVEGGGRDTDTIWMRRNGVVCRFKTHSQNTDVGGARAGITVFIWRN